MNMITIQELKDKSVKALQSWAEIRIDALATSHPNLAVASVYLKRGARNWLERESDRISEMIDDASLFICDKNGNIDADMLFSDLLSSFKNMDEVPFGKGFIQGTAGKGVIRFVIPNNPITGLLFGDTGAIRITETDLKELKMILTKE